MLKRRLYRRPRPIEPPPFLDEGARQNYAGGASRSRLPSRPRPPGDAPMAANLLTATEASPEKNGAATNATPAGVVAFLSSTKGGRQTEADANEEGSSKLEATSRDADSLELAKAQRHHHKEEVRPRGLSRDNGDPMANDPLRHSGLWVPVEYITAKRRPWTGYWTCCGNKTAFTTHCIGFEARMLQRRAEYQRDSAKQLGRARKQIADKFRDHWERAKENTSPPSRLENKELGGKTRGRRDPNAEESAPTEANGTGPDRQAPRHRPFLRRQRLDRLRRFPANEASRAAAEAAAEAAAPAQKVLPFMTSAAPASSSSPTATAASAPTDSSSNNKKPVALVRVRRTHVKSVVYLALSEAKANAFVVIDCLEGLLSVAMEGRDGTTLKAGGADSHGVNGNDDTVQDRGRRLITSNLSKKDAAPESDGKRGVSLQRENASAEHGKQSTSLVHKNTAESESPPIGIDGDNREGRSSGRDEGGAALCIRLGALPAVLGCLKEHASHKQIEPLAVKLLWVFASDGATSSSIRGNIAVTAACAARMSPSASFSASRDADCAEKGQASTTAQAPSSRDFAGKQRSDHPERGQSEESDNKAQTGEHATSGLGMLETNAGNGVVAEVESAEGGGCSAGVMTGNGRKLAAISETGQSPRTPLPAADLIFVLSVALRDSLECQRLVLNKGGIVAMSTALEHLVARTAGAASAVDGAGDKHGEDAQLARACVTVMEHLGQQRRGRVRLVRGGAVEIAIASIGRFRSDDGLLATATSLLLLLSESEEARDRILKAGGFLVVLEAMKRLVGNESVQIKGAEMLQTLIKEEPQARHELDGIKGAWQWLCQGTPRGNAIIRYAPGEKHIPGWTVCEEERLTTEEALATAAMAASDWTPYNLATFMGTMRNQHKLQIGNLAYYHFFRVVSEADLLPHVHEDVDEWRDRMRRYEDERHIQVGNITRRRLARDKSGAHVRSLGASSQASIY